MSIEFCSLCNFAVDTDYNCEEIHEIEESKLLCDTCYDEWLREHGYEREE